MKILLGKNKSGKTKYIFNSIDEDILNNRKCLLIVPSQMRFEVEKKYLLEQDKEGILEFDITSFERMMSSYISSLKLDEEKMITKLDKSVIVRRAIANNKDIFKIYAKAKNTEGFWSSVDIAIDLFRKENISPEVLEGLTFEDKFLESKIKEMAKIYKVYLEEVNNKYIDFAKEYDIFCKHLAKSDYLKDTNIYIDGFNNFSKWEYDIINVLLEKNIDITISLVTDVKNIDEASDNLTNTMYSVANNTLLKLNNLNNIYNKNTQILTFDDIKGLQPKDIEMLTTNLYKIKKEKYNENIENIYLELTTNPYIELDNVAKSIKKYVYNGYRYNDICIYTSELDNYEFPIKKLFYEYEIPYYIDSPVNILTNKLVVYILSLLDICSKNYQQEDVFTLLKTYLTDISEDDICYLENYVLEYNIVGQKWLREFEVKSTSSNSYEYNESRLNSIRERVLSVIENFRIKIQEDKSAVAIGEAIYDNIVDNNIIVNFERETKRLIEENLLSEASINSQIANKIIEVIDSLAKIYEHDVISYKKYKEGFKFAISEQTVSSMPSFLDQVMICDISKSRVDSKKIVYMIGVNEGKLPKIVSEDILFSDEELLSIEKKGISFRQNSKAKLYMQMYNITLALKSAKEKLHITYKSAELNGTTLRPSSIITLIKTILPKIKVIENVVDNNDNNDNTNILDKLYSSQTMINNYIETASLYACNNENNEKVEGYLTTAYSYKNYCNSSKEDSKINKVLEYLRKDDNLSKESINKIYGDDLHTTVSRLEQYKKCPFSYFMNYGLKAKPRKIYKLSSMDVGSFIHEIIEKFSKYLQDNNKTWQEVLINDEYVNIANNVIEEVLQKKAYLFNNNSKNMLLRDKLLKSVKKVIKIIAESFNQSKFVPLGYEIEFKEGGLYAPIEIKLNDDKIMYITGKIDRVDIAKVNDAIYTRIVDYKSSNKNLSLDDIKEGLSLQLITYMSAIINSKEKISKDLEVFPAGMLYFNFLNDVKRLKEYEENIEKIDNKITEAFRLRGIYIKDAEVLEIMDNKISSEGKLVDASLGMKGKKYLERDDFVEECKNISSILSSIGKEVLKGKIKIYPNPNCKKSPCEHCEYMSICRKNIMR